MDTCYGGFSCGLIYAFDKDLNVIGKYPEKGWYKYHSISFDGKSLFVAGSYGIGWYVDKLKFEK